LSSSLSSSLMLPVIRSVNVSVVAEMLTLLIVDECYGSYGAYRVCVRICFPLCICVVCVLCV
jgi:hypothetical protein